VEAAGVSGWASPLLITLLALLACGTLGLALGRFVEPPDKPPPLDLEQRQREESAARQTRLHTRPASRPDPDDRVPE
jgi:hypothetical protein